MCPELGLRGPAQELRGCGRRERFALTEQGFRCYKRKASLRVRFDLSKGG